MNIYKYTKTDNDEILLEQLDIDLDDYEIIELQNGNKILRKQVKLEVENYQVNL